MENESRFEADFTKGFNEGYLIAKHAPVLSEHLSKVKSEVPRIEGIRHGIDQYTLEQMRNIRSHQKEQDRSDRSIEESPNSDRER